MSLDEQDRIVGAMTAAMAEVWRDLPPLARLALAGSIFSDVVTTDDTAQWTRATESGGILGVDPGLRDFARAMDALTRMAPTALAGLVARASAGVADGTAAAEAHANREDAS